MLTTDSSFIVLRNGDIVSQEILTSTLNKLNTIKKENSGALYVLFEKSHDMNCKSQKKLIKEQIQYLCDHQLLDVHKEVPPAIKTIVRNAIQWKGSSVNIVDPTRVTLPGLVKPLPATSSVKPHKISSAL